MSAVPHGPERLIDQGLTDANLDSAATAIQGLLTASEISDQIDLVITWQRGAESDPRDGRYFVFAKRGMVAFRRCIGANGALDFEVTLVRGANPIENQDPHALSSVSQESHAAAQHGFSADDPTRRFIPPEAQSYPYAYERIAQLFDSPHAPDIIISPKDWCFGTQPGTHGALHVRQARAPLWFAGAGVVSGRHEIAARAVDIAPTALSALDFPLIDGRDATGRTATERGAQPDVFLARQDGEVIESILDRSVPTPRYLYLILMDGLHHTELEDRLATDPDALPHLRWLRERAAILNSGSMVNFPSITWPSHTAIGTGTWCGHHDVVNPSYYLRAQRTTVSPQGQQLDTEGFANPEVESIYEAFKRVRGPGCTTAAIFAPFGRGADHANLEGRNLCDKQRLRALNATFTSDEDPRWRESGSAEAAQESVLDSRGVTQAHVLFDDPERPAPDFVYHELILTDGIGHESGPHSEALRAALSESDRRIGRILALLEDKGRLDETLFIITADHGMAPQDVSLAANPGSHVRVLGLEAVIADNMIWLLDIHVKVERAPDQRTARVFVHAADRDEDGAHPPIEGARVVVTARELEHPIADGLTGTSGVFGFSTPVELASEDISIRIQASGFNPREVPLDGTPRPFDLVDQLYGPAKTSGGPGTLLNTEDGALV
jgi:hypothetical protein